MSSTQGFNQCQQKTDISGNGNTVGHGNQILTVPVTVNISLHAPGFLSPIESELVTQYRAANEDGRKTIERAFARAARSLPSKVKRS